VGYAKKEIWTYLRIDVDDRETEKRNDDDRAMFTIIWVLMLFFKLIFRFYISPFIAIYRLIRGA